MSSPAPIESDTAVALRVALRDHPPFNSVSASDRMILAQAARIIRCRPGEVVLDAFKQPSVEVMVVIAGQVNIWNGTGEAPCPPDEVLESGGIFGFSAMLTGRSVGPLAVAVDSATVAAIPADVVGPVFASRGGARFLATQTAAAGSRSATPSQYSLVDDLLVTEPLIVAPTDHLADIARLMTDHGVPCACVDLGGGRYGLVTDALLRRRVLVEGLPGTAPATEAMDSTMPMAALGESAAEALMLLLDREAEYVLVTDHNGLLKGMVAPRDFMISPTAAWASVDEQIRRCSSVDDLEERARQVPSMLCDLLTRAMPSSTIIRIYAGVRDTIVRRAIALTFEHYPQLSPDAFTWIALGSTGRREPVPSSDMDGAVAFDDSVDAETIAQYRQAFAEIDTILAGSGLVSDGHGVTPQHTLFSRTHSAWRTAAQEWAEAPDNNEGAVMTSLLVDGRPIHGDPGLAAVVGVFGELRQHPGTMRLLMQDWLATRARFYTMRELFSRRGTFNIKTQAILPIVNMARWAALSVGSPALPTVDRLRAATGSVMLAKEQSNVLIEAFEILQQLRLRYQLLAHQQGKRPSDVLVRDEMSPIDRSTVGQAVREIAAVQRRMHNLASYLPAEEWSTPPLTTGE